MKLILAAALTALFLGFGTAAHATCPSPNPNNNPFSNGGWVDGCGAPAFGLNQMMHTLAAETATRTAQTAARTNPANCGVPNFLISSGNAADFPTNFNCNADGIAAVMTSTASSTVTNTNGLAAYVHNKTVQSGNHGAGVGIYSEAISEVSGAHSWGLNTVTNDTVGLTGQQSQGIEVDVNVFSPSTVANGVTVIGVSTAQPTQSAAFLAGSLSNQALGTAVYTQGSFVSFDGVSTIALSAGAGAAPAANVGSQTINMTWYDSGAVAHAWKMGVGNTGVLNVVSTVAAGNTGVGIFNNVSGNNGTAASANVTTLHGSLSMTETENGSAASAGTIINTGTGGLSLTPGSGGLFVVSLGTGSHSGTTSCLGIDTATGKIYSSLTVQTC